MKKILIIATTFVILSCNWPFNTNTAKDDVFELTISHNIQRVMPSAHVILSWSEITVENFRAYIVERMFQTDTVWTSVAELSNEFLTSYTDTIWNDDDIHYRIGIIDIDDNILWANGSTIIPRTTSAIIPTEFLTIQPAFDADLIDDGDTIIVNPGTYKETLGIAGKDVLIISTDGYKRTILEPTPTNDPNEKKRVLYLASGVVSGFTIRKGAPSHGKPGGGIFVGQSGTVQNCWIYRNKSQTGSGLYITSNGNAYNNNIINNNVESDGRALYISDAHGEIINNTIVNNDIYINGNCDGLVLRNNIIYNSSPDISFSEQARLSDIIIDYSILDNNIDIGSNNIVANPGLLDLLDFELSPTSPGIDAGHPDDKYNDIDGSRNNIGSLGGPFARL